MVTASDARYKYWKRECNYFVQYYNKTPDINYDNLTFKK